MSNPGQSQSFFNFDRNEGGKRVTRLPSFVKELPTLPNPWTAIKKKKSAHPLGGVSLPRGTPDFTPVRDLPQNQSFSNIPLSSFTPSPSYRSVTTDQYHSQSQSQDNLPHLGYQDIPLNRAYTSSPHARVQSLPDQARLSNPQSSLSSNWSHAQTITNPISEERPASVEAFTARKNRETTIPDMSIPRLGSRSFSAGNMNPGRARTPTPAAPKGWWQHIRHPPGKLVLAMFALPLFLLVIAITIFEVVVHTQKETRNNNTATSVGCIGCPINAAVSKYEGLKVLWVVVLSVTLRELSRSIGFVL